LKECFEKKEKAQRCIDLCDWKYPWHINIFSRIEIFTENTFEKLYQREEAHRPPFEQQFFFSQSVGNLIDLDVTNTDEDLPPVAF